MPWQARALMDVKQEFVELAWQEGANRRELCRRFGISPSTGYALLARHASEDVPRSCRAPDVRTQAPAHGGAARAGGAGAAPRAPGLGRPQDRQAAA